MLESISDLEIEKGKVVLQDHTVSPLNREGVLENLLFCIASQALKWEPASKFIYELRSASYPNDSTARLRYSSWDILTDKESVFDVAKKSRLRFANARRFDDAIEKVSSKEGTWWDEVVSADVLMRRKYVDDIKWVGNKTFSFWHICLGGTNLLPLDVHVMKNLRKIGVDLNPDYITPVSRSNDSQRVRKTPLNRIYEWHEAETRKIFSNDKRFLKEDGQVDMALLDAVLWWKGANREVNGQEYFFGAAGSWTLPYAQSGTCYVSAAA